MASTARLFDVERVPDALRALLAPELPWDVVAGLDAFLANAEATAATVDEAVHGPDGASDPDGAAAPNTDGAAVVHPTAILEGWIRLGPGARVGPFAWITGPAWIGANAEVGHAAIVRGGCVIADGAKVGHASEVKHALLLPGAKAPHFNYVGDSVLGSGTNLGAGVKVANLKNDGSEVRSAGRPTGLRKFGAAIGDDAHIGCNAVLAPGTVIGARTAVYAGAMLRGEVPADSIVKHRTVTDVVTRS